MEIVSGNISVLGNAKVESNGNRIYSVIEIGDRTLENIKVSAKLDNYLTVNSSEDHALFIQNNDLVGIKRPDGKVFVQEVPFKAVFSLFFLGASLLPVYLIGAPFIYFALKINKIRQAANEVIKTHPDATGLKLN